MWPRTFRRLLTPCALTCSITFIVPQFILCLMSLIFMLTSLPAVYIFATFLGNLDNYRTSLVQCLAHSSSLSSNLKSRHFQTRDPFLERSELIDIDSWQIQWHQTKHILKFASRSCSICSLRFYPNESNSAEARDGIYSLINFTTTSPAGFLLPGHLFAEALAGVQMPKHGHLWQQLANSNQ